MKKLYQKYAYFVTRLIGKQHHDTIISYKPMPIFQHFKYFNSGL